MSKSFHEKQSHIGETNLQNGDFSHTESTRSRASDDIRDDRKRSMISRHGQQTSEIDRKLAGIVTRRTAANGPRKQPTPRQPSPRTGPERREFMMDIAPPGIWLHCTLTRIKTGWTKFSRKFALHSDKGTFLAVGIKRPRNRTSNYLVSTHEIDTSTENDDYIGKIRSNFTGSEFIAYDCGMNPRKLNKCKESSPLSLVSQVREELATISYESSLLGKKKAGPRQISVVLPHVRVQNGECIPIPCRPLHHEVDGLLALADHWSQTAVTHGQEPLVKTYTNKPAKWSSSMRSYTLNFNNRQSVPSVKNFQLVTANDKNDIFLQFCKCDADKFSLDFRFPLSPFQAFAIAISALDYKICSE